VGMSSRTWQVAVLLAGDEGSLEEPRCSRESLLAAQVDACRDQEHTSKHST
jgi:hypothetical protein